MPITPVFSVSQNDDCIIVQIRVPFVKISSAEFYTEKCSFSFFCKPYLLKLTFAHELVEDDDLDVGASENEDVDVEGDSANVASAEEGKKDENTAAGCISSDIPIDGNNINRNDNNVGKRQGNRAVYDPDDNHGSITVYLMKRVAGQFFPDLDLTTLLMQTKGRVTSTKSKVDVPSIEVIGSSPIFSAAELNDEPLSPVADSSNSNNGKGNQQPISLISRYPSYGFNNLYSRVLEGKEGEIFQIENADSIACSDRRKLRLRQENEIFEPDRYVTFYCSSRFASENQQLTDSNDDDFDYAMFLEVMKFEPFWELLWKEKETELKRADFSKSSSNITSNNNNSSDSSNSDNKNVSDINNIDDTQPTTSVTDYSFTDKERSLLARIPRKEHLVNDGSEDVSKSITLPHTAPPISISLKEQSLLMMVVDLLFAVCYEHRFTHGDFSVESQLTISRLSTTLSWFDSCDASKGDTFVHAVLFSVRRSLIFPYLRSWKLTWKVLLDVVKVLKLGKRAVIKCLLDMHSLFDATVDSYYLLNRLYITDTLVWLQSINDEIITTFAAQGYHVAVRMVMGTVASKTKIKTKARSERNQGGSDTTSVSNIDDKYNGKSGIGFQLVELEAWADKLYFDDKSSDVTLSGSDDSSSSDSSSYSGNDSDCNEKDECIPRSLTMYKDLNEIYESKHYSNHHLVNQENSSVSPSAVSEHVFHIGGGSTSLGVDNGVASSSLGQGSKYTSPNMKETKLKSADRGIVEEEDRYQEAIRELEAMTKKSVKIEELPNSSSGGGSSSSGSSSSGSSSSSCSSSNNGTTGSKSSSTTNGIGLSPVHTKYFSKK